MKSNQCLRSAMFLSMILLLIVSFIAPAIVHAAPLPAPQAAPIAAAAPAPTAFDCASVTSIPLVECQALVALYNATNGAAWTNSTGWLANTAPCSWFGITCAGDHVTQIGLYGNLWPGRYPHRSAIWFPSDT